jgi:hypothetical protein
MCHSFASLIFFDVHFLDISFSSRFPFLRIFYGGRAKGAQGNPGTLPEYHLRAEITIEFRTNADAFARAAGKSPDIVRVYVSAFFGKSRLHRKAVLKKYYNSAILL